MVPKFRAWDVVDEKMYLWEDVIFDKQKGDDFISFGYEEGIVTSYDHEQIIMQSTSLKDCHGIEIFEGDVTDYNCNIYVVAKIDACLGLAFLKNGEKTSFKPLIEDMVNLDRVEVIGNIYENPELLEG
ncbi:YopX family protein [Streptococcus equi subsp. zooepidemicus]|uniref:YopX family protein n=1 Tax=Streptococcus equi TaxID=1336 RepID=UPI001E41471E|nr:YopX family protein [Streptococcus equi]MCD3414372.1 YopX family protein [Streptococcus equi subsp. zooepidemicus]